MTNEVYDPENPKCTGTAPMCHIFDPTTTTSAPTTTKPYDGQCTEDLDVIAAVVIGGASLNGGVGSIPQTIVGVFIIGVLRNGLNLMGFSPFVQGMVIGGVIVFAVALDTLKTKER